MSVLKELVEQRDAATDELKTITETVEAREPDERDLTEEEETRSAELIASVDDIDGRIKEEKRNTKRALSLAEARKLVKDIETPAEDGTDASVVDEPMVYGEGSPFSYFADICRRHQAVYGGVDLGASDRLNQWGHQVERELANGSKQGKAAEKQMRESFREMGPDQMAATIAEHRSRGRVAVEQKAEQRTGVVSGGGATASAASGGAAFVTPMFFVDKWAPYREFGRAFIDQCNKQTLPNYGMEVYIPFVSGPAGVAQQTADGNAVTEVDPTFGYKSGSLQTIAGQVIVSQQLLDRAGPNFSFDTMIFEQLMRDYAPKVDIYTLQQALAGAGSQSWAGSSGAFDLTTTSGAGGFYGQVSKAQATIRTTAGTILNPTHLFLTPQIWEYIAATSDSTGRPLVIPDYAGAWNAAAAGSNDGDVGIEGVTGYRLAGLPVFTDGNIPSIGTTSESQAIVGDLAEVFVYEGDVVPRVIPQTYAANLQTQ
jgi:HK97 family phage major capsid protein